MAERIIQELEMYQGDTYKESFQMQTWDPVLEVYYPRNLDGLQIDMHVKPQVSQSRLPSITASTLTGEITLSDVIISVADSLALPVDNSVASAYRTLDDDRVHVWDETNEVFVDAFAYTGPMLAFVSIVIPTTQTSLLRAGSYVHDVQIIDGTDVETFREGPVLVPGEVTAVVP